MAGLISLEVAEMAPEPIHIVLTYLSASYECMSLPSEAMFGGVSFGRARI